MTATDLGTLGTAAATARLEELEDAWNRADGAAFGAAFTQDADFVDIRGGHHVGPTAIGGGHQALYDGIYSGSTIRYQLETARQVAPGCVIAVANATLNAPTGPTQGIGRSRLTAVLLQDGATWSITAFHNILVQENA